MTVINACIIIPTKNEEENIGGLVTRIFQIVPDISVLVVDDRSIDKTREIVRDLQKRFPKLNLLCRDRNFGYGKSIIEGFQWSTYHGCNLVLTMDADNSHDPIEVPAMMELLKKCDLVIGSRYIKGGGIRNWGIHRKILSRFSNFYVRSILGLKIRDATTGFCGYKITAIDKIIKNNLQSDGYAFLVESKYILLASGAPCAEHPIQFTERRAGKSKMSLKIIWESIWLPWRLKKSKL